MIEVINELSKNVMLFRVGVKVSVIFTVILLVLLFSKTSHDERGRAIIGKASIFSTVAFILLVNLFANISDYIEVDRLTMENAIQWIYNIVIIIESVTILILKKIS